MVAHANASRVFLNHKRYEVVAVGGIIGGLTVAALLTVLIVADALTTQANRRFTLNDIALRKA